METLLAKAVPPGGTIGIVSPASPYNTYADVLRGIAWWESKGYKVKLKVLEERPGHLGVPILYPLPFGHGERFAMLPLGVQAT